MKRTFNLTKRFREAGTIVASLMLAFSFAACSSSDPDGPDPDDPNVDPNAHVKGEMVDLTLHGYVTDTDGRALQGVTVKSGTHTVTTNEAGAFTFDKADVNDGRTLVEFSKNGYFPVTRAAKRTEEGRWDIVMVARSNPAITASKSYSSSEAQTLSVRGMKVDLKANGFVNKASGQAYTGKVNADMLYLDPNDENFDRMMPGGDLSAIRTDNSRVSLISYGMSQVCLTDDNGNELQLADGSPAELTFPVPDGMDQNLPAEIPLWSFNDENGQWEEEGVARLENGVYKGSVRHFSWVNLDYPEEQAVVSVKVTDSTGAPVAWQKVRIGQISRTADDKGVAQTEVPANTKFTITVPSEWYGGYKPEVKVEVPALSPRQRYEVNLVLPKIYNVKGRVVNGSHSEIAYIWIVCDGKEMSRSVTQADGSFTLPLPANFKGDAKLFILAGKKISKDLRIGEEDIDLGTIDVGEGETPNGDKLLSPGESKRYFESVATDFMNKFNPDDQRDLIDLIRYFSDNYGDLWEPEEWNLDDYCEPEMRSRAKGYFTPKRMLEAVGRALRTRNFPMLTRAANDVYDFKRFSGIYEPGNTRWVKTGDSNDIVFRFKNRSGEQCEVKATGSGSEWKATSDGKEVRVPENVRVTFNEGSRQHVSANVVSSFNKNAHTVKSTVNVTVANVKVVAETDGNDSRIKGNVRCEVSGETLVTADAQINGRNLCNIDYLRDLFERMDSYDDEVCDAAYDEFCKLVSTGTGNVDVMNRLQVKANVSKVYNVIEAGGGYYDSDDYDNKATAKNLCQKDCDVLNANIVNGIYYSGSAKQAQLWFQPCFYEEEYYAQYWEWYPSAALRFASDGSLYSFEDYFGNSNFLSVENAFTSLIDSYKRFWR